jgi:hypothetical protein
MSSKILLDNPSERPGLGFEAYASGLKDIIELSDPQFCIGIFGGWGSGKTTLMRAIERKLNKEFVSVWFNAWRYEKEEHLIIPLLDALRDALVTWATDTQTGSAINSPVRHEAIRAASTIAKAARAIFAGMAVKVNVPLIEVSLDANRAVAEWRENSIEKDRQDAESPQSPYHASFKALKDSLAEFILHGKQRIVVFIDDLDRCLPSNALQVLESMKLFFDLEGFIFVVGLDQRVIEASINWNYRFSDASQGSKSGPPVNGADYIKKLFQVPFNLPAISPVQLDDYLTSISWDIGGQNEGQDNLVSRVRPHLDFLVEGSEVNPREIKRFINAFILQKLIQPELDDEVTLVLQTMAFRSDWRDVYQIFRSRRDEFVEAAKRELEGERGALKDLDPRLENLPESFAKYMDSTGGHKLLSLDAPHLDEQIRSFDVTHPPETLFSALSRKVASLTQLMNEIDPLEISESRKAVDLLRREVKDIDSEIRASRILDNSNNSETARDAARQLYRLIQQLKNDGDILGFSLRRGDDMPPEDFNKFVGGRSTIVDELVQLHSLLDYLAKEVTEAPA